MKQIARNFLQGRSGKTVCNNGSVGLARYLAHKLHDFTKIQYHDQIRPPDSSSSGTTFT